MNATGIRPLDDDGFTLAELLVAVLMTGLLVGGAVSVLVPTGHRARSEPEALDLQQRIRAGSRSLEASLRLAGAGLHVGPRAGNLSQTLPPVLPRRIGASRGDAPDVARGDVISILSLPVDAVETTTALPFSGASTTLQASAACDATEPACGFRDGDGVLIVDPSGQFDLFTATWTTGMDLGLRPRAAWSGHSYPAGSTVAQFEGRSYEFDSALRQLRLYDTDVTDVAVLDDVTGFAVEYFGTPTPPVAPKPPSGASNCLYDDTGTLRPGDALPATFDGLAALPLSRFTDGPWCGTGDTRFDADLLRVRRVRVVIRGQVSSAAWRGTTSLFSVPGTSRTAWRWEPDLVVSVDVAPPNLDLER